MISTEVINTNFAPEKLRLPYDPLPYTTTISGTITGSFESLDFHEYLKKCIDKYSAVLELRKRKEELSKEVHQSHILYKEKLHELDCVSAEIASKITERVI